MTELPSIDVVIPISREWMIPYLEHCLPSIAAQDYPRDLVSIYLSHVVDDDMEDMSGLMALARAYDATVVCTHPEDPSFNICKAYNVAARKGRHEAVALLDADIVFSPWTLRYAVAELLKGRGAIVPVVRSDKRPGDDLFTTVLPNLRTEAAWNELVGDMGCRRDANGNIVVPRTVFEFLHGYDERFYGWGAADHDLFVRVNATIGVTHMMDTGCPKSFHQLHKQRPDTESAYTRRNRTLMVESKTKVRNPDGWGRVSETGVLAPRDGLEHELSHELAALRQKEAKKEPEPKPEAPEQPPAPPRRPLVHEPYNRTFAGIKAQHAASTYTELDRIFKAHEVQRIVELGSADGALSVYLGLCGRRLGIPVYTIDVNPLPSEETYRVLADLGVTVFRMNCLNQRGATGILSLISDVPIYLLCDNGNKPAEFRAYAPRLLPGSAVSVHDWIKEIGPQHVDGVVAECKLEPFRPEVWSKDLLRMATWTVPDRGQEPQTALGDSTEWRKGAEAIWHRETVGGSWDQMGKAQLNILKRYGLEPSSRLLDVGCGALRLGVKAIDFLDADCYFGLDCFRELLETGIERELKPHSELMDKRPQFTVNETFELSAFGDVRFDMAMAQSVFTHMPPQDIELCVRNVMARLSPDGTFLASYTGSTDGWAKFGFRYPEMTGYPVSFFESVARRLGVVVEHIGEWGIPQNKRGEQLLLAFRHRGAASFPW